MADNIFVSLLLTTTILELIFSTGGINSFLFILLYFAAFCLAFMLEPASIFTFMVLCIITFLPSAVKTDTLANLTKILSLILISPLAYFFGYELQNRQAIASHEKQLEIAAYEATTQINEDVTKILRDKQHALSQDDIQSLQDIAVEANLLNNEAQT